MAPRLAFFFAAEKNGWQLQPRATALALGDNLHHTNKPMIRLGAEISEKPSMLVIGWQERVDLPSLGLTNLRAKIDTGAKTSALHATNIAEFDKDGESWVRFHTKFNDDTVDLDVECPIHDRRDITNTSGVPENRIIIRTRFRITNRVWTIDLSLTERSDMKFRMIVGRTAIRRHAILVHPGRRDLTQPGRKSDKQEG